ncbi:TlpA disulfide reductase family protein [Sphingobacterium faecium]|uniref:TlpA family protein disulfide reductase n=1 Tax=Sphingobacterium faecium TaxID=34087 RepID=UPI00320BA6AC
MTQVVKIILFIIFCQVTAQAQEVTIYGNVYGKNPIPKYIYRLYESSKLDQQQIVNERFSFKLEKEIKKDISGSETFIVSDSIYKDFNALNIAFSNGDINPNRDLISIIIDRKNINCSIDNDTKIVYVKNSILNEEMQKIVAINREFGDPLLQTDNSRQEEWDNNKLAQYLVILNNYPQSLVSYEMLLSMIANPSFYYINSGHVFKNREQILNTVLRIDTATIGSKKATLLYNAYDNMILTYSDKKNALFPLIKLTSQNKKVKSLKEVSGNSNYLVIDFWHTACGPCRQQHPEFSRISKVYADQSQLKFISISMDSKIQDWRSYLQNHNFNFINYWLDSKQYPAFQVEAGIVSYPRYILVDMRTNRIVNGNIKIEHLTTILETILKENSSIFQNTDQS